MLGIFNVSQRALTEIIPLSSFPGVVPGVRYVIRAHNSGKTSSPVKLGSPAAFVSGSYEVGGFDILTAAPVFAAASAKHGHVSVANFGLVGKMTGSVAIVRQTVARQENGRILVDTSLKALGVLGEYRTLPSSGVSLCTSFSLTQHPRDLHFVLAQHGH